MFVNIDPTNLNTLCCSHCSDTHLHQFRVETFERNEDSDDGIHTTIESMKTVVDNNLSGNPSTRRQGLKIMFRCEQCNETSTLRIYQHKGQTFFEWE